jgi:hypothetical protein
MNIQVKTTAPGGTRTADARNISLTARGGSCIGFEVVAGDTLTLINAEGLQPSELLVLSRQGIPAAKVFVGANDLVISGSDLEALLAGAGADAVGPCAVINEIGASGDNARIFSVFDAGCAAGK